MLDIFVTKADGSKEIFVPAKLEHSLRRAGAGEDVAKDIVKHILSLADKQHSGHAGVKRV